MALSKFESLSPELIVEISDYFDAYDLYYSFYNLNQRINKILDNQCYRLYVNFIGISKIKFDLYCDQILPHIVNRIISLTLCGIKSSTPGQLELFLTRFHSFGTIFLKLESLKLIDFAKSDVEMILPHVSRLTHLKYLSIGGYKRIMPININSDELFNENIIFPISLRSLSFPYEISNEWIETSNTTISFLEQLHAHSIHIDALPFFLQKFPYLEHLTTVLSNNNPNNVTIQNLSQSTVTFHSLKYLNVNITSQVDFDSCAQFLKSVPQLDSLSVEALNPHLTLLDANSWESILPVNLRLFRFDLTITLPNNPDHIQILERFKTKFGYFINGRFFRLSTVRSSIISILYWPDDEVLVGSTATIVYPNVNHLELWWNLSKSTQSICPNIPILQCSSLEHITINMNLSITEERFASVLVNTSNNVQKLTCSADWLLHLLENKQYEWICLMLTMRIRKLIIDDDEILFSDRNLIAFSRTFIHLHEITIKVESIDDFFLLLNTLQQLTMANIEINTIINHQNDITQWIRRNTILIDFVANKQITRSNTSKLILWINSRNTSNLLSSTNDLYLKHPFIHQYIYKS